MPRDIINAPALQQVINDALEGGPHALRGYWPQLRPYIRRLADEHFSVKRARRRASDPEWAQEKFRRGQTLHRFNEEDREHLVGLIRKKLALLEQIAELARDRGSPLARNAAAYLRRLPHHRDDISILDRKARMLIEKARSARIRAELSGKRFRPLRQPIQIETAGLIGRRCTTIDEVIQLGRRAQNCLADNVDYWAGFASGESDIWSLTCGDRLAAILKVRSSGKYLEEAEAPSGLPISLRDAQGVALFCKEAGIEIGENCMGVLPAFAAALLIEPKVMEIEGQIAIYAEWPTAVRIDLAPRQTEMNFAYCGLRTLALSFDPGRSLATSILEGYDPRRAVETFGRKALRKVLRAVAMEQTVPSLVQHRLMALAA